MSRQRSDCLDEDTDPWQAEFVECWSETIIRNGIPLDVVDDPPFRNTLVIASRMGQTVVCMVKGTKFGKKDTTLPHRHTFTRKVIPTTDKRLNEENIGRLKPKMQKVGGTIMSDGMCTVVRIGNRLGTFGNRLGTTL